MNLLSLWVADPDFPTPLKVRKALTYAINHGCTHYHAPKEFDILPQAISDYYESTIGVNIDPLKEIKITHGAGEALYLIFHEIVARNDEVILPDPTYGT